MINQTGNETIHNGKTLFTKTWLPDKEPVKANIILVHGIGEYCERYEPVAKVLTDQQFAVYAFDHAGHGKSEGKRGVTNYQNAYEIITKIKQRLKASQPRIPIFLYGHSMGGGVVLSYGLHSAENLKGIIATSPAVGMANPMPELEVKLLSVLKKVIPDFTISNGLPQNALSHDDRVNQAYNHDPLVHDRVSLELGYDLIQKGKEISAFKGVYPVPLLIVQGTGDKLVDPAATENFAANVKGNVTFKRFDGGYHELHNELNKQELFDVIINWINQIISA